MVNRQQIHVALFVSVSVCTGFGIYLLYRYRRRFARSTKYRSAVNVAALLQSKPLQSSLTSDCVEIDSDSDIPSNESQIPDGSVPLTLDQAAILIHLLCESNDDQEQLHQILTTIANASAFQESQFNLSNVNCIASLRELLQTRTDPMTQSKVLLALNDLALNEFAINQFRGIVSIVIELCRSSSPRTWLRSCGLNLLINMSVLNHLHSEYMLRIEELADLIRSTLEFDDEALSSGKILVNLSKNRSNLNSLLQLTGLDFKTIVEQFKITDETSSRNKSEDILQRFLTFYNNLGESIIHNYSHCEDSNNNQMDPKDTNYPREEALYFEYFHPEKQFRFVSLLRLDCVSERVADLMKRLGLTIEKIRQYQTESMIPSINEHL